MAPKMAPGHQGQDRLAAAQRRDDQAVFDNDQNERKLHGVIVWSSKGPERKQPWLVYQDVKTIPHQLARQALTSREWSDLPLPHHLGMPLQFSKWKVPDHPGRNYFVDTMCINPDFERADKDIAKHGFNTPRVEAVYGSIMVVRSDGQDLWPRDIEPLAEFVGTKLPNIFLYAASMNFVTKSELQVSNMRKKWKAAGKDDSFAGWWFDWRKKKVKMGLSDYADLQCPVVGALPPELPDSKVDKLKSAAKGWTKECTLQ